MIAGKTLVDWTEDERVVYPSTPTAPAPKDGTADEPDDDPNNDPNNDPADDKSEHGGESNKNAMPRRKKTSLKTSWTMSQKGLRTKSLS